MPKFRSNGGFTLTELLVVVSVIILLSLFAIPKLQAAADASKQVKVQHDLKTIEEALESHFKDHGYYPVKLGDLVKHGYIKPQKNLFQSPICRCWYFYAVDDNVENDRPRAYALGAPSRESLLIKPDDNNDLARSGPLPRGSRPDWRAPAWLNSTPGTNLELYDELGDEDSIVPLPSNLGMFRKSCQPTAPGPCDLITN